MPTRSFSNAAIATLCGTIILLFSPAGFAHMGLEHDIERETEVLAQRPDDVAALIRRARYYRLDGQMAASMTDLDRAVTLTPNDSSPRLQRGLTLSKMGRNVEAESELSRVLDRGPDTVAALAERAEIRSRTGRAELAIEDLDRALSLAPAVDLFLRRGALQESAEQWTEASEGYRDGIEQLGDAVLLVRALIRVEADQGRPAEALRVVDAQIAKGSLLAQWYLERAQLLEALGQAKEAATARSEALSNANRMLRLRPTAGNLISRAKVHLAMDNAAAARRDLENALRHSPKMKEAEVLLSTIDYEQASPQQVPPLH
jgi:tetratricopeptide (TPR) repeat protein